MASEFNADDILEVSTFGFTSGYKSCRTSRLTFGPTIVLTFGPVFGPSSSPRFGLTSGFTFGPVSGLKAVFSSDSAFGSVILIGSNFAPRSH